VSDDAQHQVTLPTAASGRAILFPRAEGLRGRELTATARCQGQTVRQSFDVNDDADGVVQLRLSQPRDLPARPIVDVAFVLDTTGSMSEEIAAVKDTIRAVTSQLDRSQVTFRLGMVEFRDIGDQFVTRVHPFNADLREFSQQVSDVTADGGGDTPENVNAGLRSAVEELAWRSDSVARLAFLVGDAPPHLDYQDVSYASTMREAAHRGIKVHTIAASGMDVVGQVVWRQVAQYTGGRNMFVLRGGAGPQSTGGGDPISSCGGTQTAYTSGNLDQLITGEIRSELAALNEDPLRIAGLHQDENAKPCHERLVLAR
jgi:Mg-chelatase subunit ChlD